MTGPLNWILYYLAVHIFKYFFSWNIAQQIFDSTVLQLLKQKRYDLFSVENDS